MPIGARGSRRPNPAGDRPDVAPTAFVDPAAILIGNVHVGAGTLIGPTAVLRADESDDHGLVQPVVIGDQCNVQDGAIVHALKGTRVVVKSHSSLSHGAIVHGPAEIGEGCFVGFRAVVFNASLADGVFVGSAAVLQNVRVAANAMIPPGRMILTQADALSPTGSDERAFMRTVVAANLKLTEGYGGMVESAAPWANRALTTAPQSANAGIARPAHFPPAFDLIRAAIEVGNRANTSVCCDQVLKNWCDAAVMAATA